MIRKLIIAMVALGICGFTTESRAESTPVAQAGAAGQASEGVHLAKLDPQGGPRKRAKRLRKHRKHRRKFQKRIRHHRVRRHRVRRHRPRHLRPRHVRPKHRPHAGDPR